MQCYYYIRDKIIIIICYGINIARVQQASSKRERRE